MALSIYSTALIAHLTIPTHATTTTGGKDEDDGIDPSYVDLGLFSNAEKVFEDWSDVLCAGGDNELRAIHESMKR